MTRTGIVGNRAEHKAAEYLRRQGLALIERNFRCRLGEIDLIMMDADTLVFVEVRYRASERFGGALASVDQHKQTRLRRAARLYLQQHKSGDCACRFDILALGGALHNPTIDWVCDAF